jgi:2-hydroxy-3-oxopropionate reductase
MVGGAAETIERCKTLFRASGDRIYHMGEVGAGASAKLAQQMMTCANIVGFSEGLRVAKAAGLNREQFLEMLEGSTAQSDVSRVWSKRYAGLAQEHIHGFFEGLRPAIAMAHAMDVPVPLTALTQQLLGDAFRE